MRSVYDCFIGGHHSLVECIPAAGIKQQKERLRRA